MKAMIKWMLIAVAFLSLPTACTKDYPANYHGGKDIDLPPFLTSGELPKAWFNLVFRLVKVLPGNTGPVQTRSFGYIGLALYESVVPGNHNYRSIQSQLNGLPALPKADNGKNYIDAISANAALANMAHHMFGNANAAQNFSLDSLEEHFNTEFKSFIAGKPGEQAALNDFDRSVGFGKKISEAIYNWSLTDGGDQAYLNPSPPYVLPVGPGMYVVQPGQAAQHPTWGNNRTFIAGDAVSTQPGAPPAYSTNPASQYYTEQLEVYNESINQDPEHTIIARYWAALPPPTVSLSILTSVLTDKNADFFTSVLAYCKLGIGLADAFVSCYKTKYFYTQERPITYIRANFNAGWSPLIPTPPFPDYTSAHSVQTGAAARIFADLFGDNTTFTDYTINDLGFTPRTFTKFSDYANEVGLSRIYGGIHLRSSDFVGLAQGDKVGQIIGKLKFEK